MRSIPRSLVGMHRNQACFDRIETLRDCEAPLQIEINPLILDA